MKVEKNSFPIVNDIPCNTASGASVSAADANKVFQFWFGDDVFSAFPAHKTRCWFDNWRQVLDEKEQSTHIAFIEHEFRALIGRAANSDLQDWTQDSHRGLALILLLDRLAPRVLTNQTVIRECNRLAIECCSFALQDGLLEELTVIETCFYLAPLSKARREAQRQLGLRLLEEQLAVVSDPESSGYMYRSLVQHHLFNAIKHQERRTAQHRPGGGVDVAPGEDLRLSA